MSSSMKFNSRILSSQQLKKLSEHKYSCSSTSLLDPLLQPWWNWLVSKTPLWLAPNLITIIGLIINILTTLVLISYSPDGTSPPPRWTCLLCAFGLFVYQSLDSIDGKQARRTNTSSPLGELFDHGCDSISTIFVALSACISCQLGHFPNWLFFQCFCAITLFYCAHWQTYVSGTLRFGKIDVTEAQITIMGIHVVSAIFGPEIWIAKGTSVLSPSIPLSLVVLPAFIIAQKSPQSIFEQHSSLYILAFGMVAAKVTNKLVIAHMTKSEMEYLDWSQLGPALLFLNQYFNCVVPEIWLLWFTLIWGTQDLLRYCSQVCLEICDHLHIQLFKIPYPPKGPATVSQGTNPPTTSLSMTSGAPHDKNGGSHHRKHAKQSSKKQLQHSSVSH
ncbi:choline/ethanolaminephosphotransferase 1 isoform X4 [Episyrphus balteatus]|uniref:choline/ethanolaminephosphotransferase 1 isoform X4 n=1 Tax=Episyrphus balteatus TaxID=286459 RepID=UPI0024867185|nr:choline/ethanolaminephosphotransferase 1 isoform X4 [Episyrphus balteatus]